MGFQFSTKPHDLESLPVDIDAFMADADAFIDEIVPNWKKNKTYNYKLDNGNKESVTTYGKTIDGEYWLARVSKHSQNKHEDFIKYLIGENDEEGEIKDLYSHSKYETEYIEVLDKWEKIELESMGQVTEEIKKNWVAIKGFYELGSPLTTREFNQFLIAKVPTKSSNGFVIQLVANKPLESGNVHGVYVSIERIKFLENGETEWIMCTSSDSGGNVPKWLQNAMISKAVSSDVPSFLNWINCGGPTKSELF